MILSRSIRLSTKYCTKSIYYSLSTQLTHLSPITSPPTTSPHSSPHPATIESLSLFISQSQGSSQATTIYTLPKKFLDALKEYHNFYEHTLVPGYFIIPSKYPWPQELWGYPLGSEVKLMRRLKAKYKFEGTELKKYDTKVTAEHKTQLLMRAFRLYKEIYGNIQIKTEYVIKNDDARWPAEMIGLELGMKLRLVVYNGYYKDLHKELDQMGVAWSSMELRHDKFLLALKTYKSIYGNLYCSKSFSIPTGEKARKWPKELHGWKLGKLLDNIRAGLVSIDRVRAEADELGFVWDMREYQWKIVQNMLITFKQQYGHMGVPKWFRVPEHSPWLETDWGKRLGVTCYNIRKRGDYYRHHAWLKEAGFVWETKYMKLRRERKKKNSNIQQLDQQPASSSESNNSIIQ